MKLSDFFLYLLVMAGVTYLVRAIPFILIRRKIKSRFLNSFLYYIPYHSEMVFIHCLALCLFFVSFDCLELLFDLQN